MTSASSLLIIIGIALMVLMIWNLSSLNHLKKHGNSQTLSDAKYYELKFKNDFLLAVLAVITTAAGIFGYNSLESAEKAVKIDFQKKVDTVNIAMSQVSKKSDSLNASLRSKSDSVNIYLTILTEAVTNKIDKVQKSSASYERSLELLQNKQTSIDSQNIVSDRQITKLANRIKELNSKNILQQNYYIIDSLACDQYKQSDYKDSIYYFKNLVTTRGDKLPLFNSPPLVIISSNDFSEFRVIEVTKEYFQVFLYGYEENKNRYRYFRVLISETK